MQRFLSRLDLRDVIGTLGLLLLLVGVTLVHSLGASLSLVGALLLIGAAWPYLARRGGG